MGCSKTLAGLNLSCETSKGGIKEVYIAQYPGLGDSGYTSGLTVSSADTVTAISTAVTFYKYEFRRNTGSLTSTLNVDDANGVNYVSSDLVLQFNKMDAAKRTEIAALSLQDTLVLAVDCNGMVWVLGANEAVMASAGTGQTGTAKTDGNFYQITLQANDDSYPMPYTGALSDLTISAGA